MTVVFVSVFYDDKHRIVIYKKDMRVASFIYFNPVSGELYTHRRKINLSIKESSLLTQLITASGHDSISTRNDIANATWPNKSMVINNNNIVQLISLLRRKMRMIGLENPIHNYHSRGYKLLLPVTVIDGD